MDVDGLVVVGFEVAGVGVEEAFVQTTFLLEPVGLEQHSRGHPAISPQTQGTVAADRAGHVRGVVGQT